MTAPVRAPRPTPRRAPAVAPGRAPRPELYVVAAPGRRARTGAVLAVATVVVFGAVLAAAVFHSLLVSGQVRLDDINTRIRTEQDQLQRDQLRLASSQSPERIALEATRLGLVAADRQTWINPGTDAAPVITGERTASTTTPTTTPARSSGRDTSPTAQADELAVANGTAGNAQ